MKTYIKILTSLVLYFMVLLESNAQWELCSDPVIASGSQNFRVCAYGNRIVASDEMSYPRLFESLNNGTNWIEKKYPATERLSINSIFEMGKYLFVGSNKVGILRSSDAGEYWEIATKEYTTLSIGEFARLGNKIFASSSKGLLESNDTGKTWKLNVGIGETQAVGVCINENNIYTALPSKKMMFVSTDTGKTWTNIQSGIIKDFKPYRIKANGNNIYMFTYNSSDGFYYSSDKGQNWEMRMDGIPLLKDRFFVDFIVTGNNLMLYISTSLLIDNYSGVYISIDSGKSWKQKNTGLLNSSFYGTRIPCNSDYVFLSMNDYGIFRAKLTDLFAPTGVEDIEIEYYNKHFFAYSPRPTPTKDVSRILLIWDRSFDLENAITGVCDSHGNIIENRENMSFTYLSNITAELTWDCSRVGSGVYFVIVKHNGITDCIPVVVVK
jgi:hypothetical protein